MTDVSRDDPRRPLRIAVWHNLPSGGGKRQLYTHVQGLLARGHYVESWCPDTADQDYLPLSRLVTEHVVPLRDRSDLFSSPIRPLHITRRLLSSMEAHCRACADAINAGQFDLLFAGACLYLRTAPIGSMVTVPSAIYLGEPYRWFYEAMPELPWIAPRTLPPLRSLSAIKERWDRRSALESIRVQARAELEYVKQFDVVLVNSIFSRETILRTYNIEARVCLLGVDLDYYRPTGEAKEPFVVGLGTIYHGKGVDRAIRAVGAVAPEIRPPLVWIGNGAGAEELRGFERLALRLGVTFVPKIHIPDAEVISLLSRATAMVFTSRLEPFGLAPLEANACGTPVVAIAEGGARESIVDGVNGFLASDEDPAQLGSLIARLMSDSTLAAAMGTAAREHVRSEWDLAKCTDTLERALATACRLGATAPRRVAAVASSGRMTPTHDVRCHVEQHDERRGTLRIRGWAFIDDGRDATGSEAFVVLRCGNDVQVEPTTKELRPDVTAHFGGVADYDESGFTVSVEIRVRRPFSTGLLIVRESRTSLHMLGSP